MSAEGPRRPNVLCLVTDQQRADHLGCAGNSVLQTPNIDRLAAGGVRFTRSYTSDPMCCPARATLWTGHRSSAHGVRFNDIHLDPAIPTICTALAAAGYRTFGVGKYHVTSTFHDSFRGAEPEGLDLTQWPESRRLWNEGVLREMPSPFYGLQSALLVGGHGDFFWGDYRNWLLRESPEIVEAVARRVAAEKRESWTTTWPSHAPFEKHHSHWIVDRVIDRLKEHVGKPEPFFCWCSFPDPHHPYHAPYPYHEMYDPADVPEPARREGELDSLPPHHSRDQRRRPDFYRRTPEVCARTYGMISNIDVNVGRLLDALEELGLRDNTLIVYLSDHGDLMGDHWLQQKGPFHFDGLIRVPFIWNWPGHIATGTHGGLVSLLDFAPTILDFCGVPVPTEARNPYVRALLQWPGRSLRPMLEGKPDKAKECLLIEQDTLEHGLRLRTLVTDRYRMTLYAGQPYGELFDLQEDPQEFHNLWDDPARSRLRMELRGQVLEESLADSAFIPHEWTGG